MSDRKMPGLQRTPDGRYIIVDGVLWRASNPALPEAERQALVDTLMTARRAVGAAKRAGNAVAEKAARARVHAAKVALGERGPVWWEDGAPDFTRRRVGRGRGTPYNRHPGLDPGSSCLGDVARRRSGAPDQVRGDELELGLTR